jgi:tetratricopeptide (TPR) repeat protein
MDLGVARLNDEALRLSQTGAFVGSIHYAAPECFADGGRNVDGRADLHALGLVLYELACGTNPYQADSVPEILKRVLQETPRRLGDVNPQLSPFFEEVVHALLAKKPADRFADAATLVAVLDAGEKSEWWKTRAKAIRADTKRPLRRIRIPRETAVYGRENELSKLRAMFDKAKSGDGLVVVVEGEAGIGKSRVVDEFVGRLQRDGEDINFLFGSYPPGGAATAAGAFSTAFREQFGEAGSAAYLTQTPILVPAFDALLRGEPTPSGAEPLTKESLQTCFVHAARNLAAERPTVLLVDDLHFATEEARALFTSLAMAVPGHRVLLVGTTRPGIDEKWFSNLTRLPQTSQMTIERLFPKDLTALLKDSLKSETLALSLAGQIAQKSDGNPFFVFEIVRGLRDGQFLTQKDDGTWVSTRVIDDIKIPSSILDLVNARVADLTEEERDLLDVACCWGFEFDPGLIGEVLGVGRIPLLKRFGQIERQHRLVRASGRNYVFDHHQVQEALYGSLHEQMREEYHAALANAVEARASAADKDPAALDGATCVDLCEHFLKGAQGGRALRYLEAADAHLVKGYLYAQAVALAERALAVPGLLAGVVRSKACVRLAVVLDSMGRRARQEEAAREAERVAESAGDAEALVAAKVALGNLFWITSRYPEADEVLRAALEIAKARGDKRGEGVAMGNLGNVSYSQGRLAQAREQHARQLAISREIGDGEGEVRAMGNLGIVLLSEGRLGEAEAFIERLRARNREVGDRRIESTSAGNLGVVYWAQGRLGHAKELIERYLVLSRETGHRVGEAIALHNLGDLLREQGDDARSEELGRSCLALAEEIGSRNVTAATLLSLGSLRAALRGGEAGRDALLAARDLARAIHAPGVETLASCELALLPGGDAADAQAVFAANEERLDSEEGLRARLLLWKATGDRAHLVEAKRLLDEATAHVDEETRASMLANLRVNREIAAAAKAAGL